MLPLHITRRRIFRSYSALIIGWSVLIILMHITLGGLSPLLFLFGPSQKLSSDQLKRLMASSPRSLYNSSLFLHPLLQILSAENNVFHFFDLPKRKTHLVYSEITSANRDSRFPLAPDFTFHIDYSRRNVVLFEDYGPACIYRLFVYPSLPTNSQVLHGMTLSNLSAVFLVMEFDGEEMQRCSLQRLAEASQWPFVYPLSVRHPSLMSGVGAYTPLCYQKSLRIFYENDRDFPVNLLDLNINCTANELLCPVHIYSAVSSHKFPAGTSIPTEHRDLKVSDLTSQVVELLKNPELNGPAAGERCSLSCFELCSKCQRVLYHRIQSAAVITSLRIRVFATATSLLSPDWTDIFISAYFDDVSTPRFDRIPLGSLFGATASMNDFSGAAFGKRIMYCDYDEADVSFDQRVMTGYLYFPMPYWQEALIVLEGAESLRASITVCFQVTAADNYYDPTQTGFLHAVKTYYSGNVDGWRQVLDVEGGWGHIVSLSMEVDNLVPIHGVPLAYRWAALQADPVIHIDGSRSASVLGTGLEDYFSYAHGFAGAENTTYSFVGVYHAGRPSPGRSDPLTWHCYRQHVLDPVIFRSSVRFYMEGTGSRFSDPSKSLSYQEHYRLRSAGLPTLAHVVMYYFRPNVIPSSKMCDQIWLGNSTSEHQHQFRLTERHLGVSGNRIPLSERRFLGDTSRNRTYSYSRGRAFSAGDVFSFDLGMYSPSASLYRLRRTSYSAPRHWNDRARWLVNGIEQDVWFIPMGSISEEYSLVDSDRILVLDATQLTSSPGSGGFSVARFQFLPISDSWNDISYELCPVHD